MAIFEGSGVAIVTPFKDTENEMDCGIGRTDRVPYRERHRFDHHRGDNRGSFDADG